MKITAKVGPGVLHVVLAARNAKTKIFVMSVLIGINKF